MYISVPKNYGGNAFPHPDAPRPREVGGMPRPVPPFADHGAQVQPSPPPPPPPPPPPRPAFHGSAPTPVAPLGKIPRDCPPPPPPDRDCPPPCEGCEPCAEAERPACGDAPPCPAENKNPLTCLFEALRGRKKAGFDADDFLLIGLIALLMGKEGSEDIVLILALLLLV